MARHQMCSSFILNWMKYLFALSEIHFDMHIVWYTGIELTLFPGVSVIGYCS